LAKVDIFHYICMRERREAGRSAAPGNRWGKSGQGRALRRGKPGWEQSHGGRNRKEPQEPPGPAGHSCKGENAG